MTETLEELVIELRANVASVTASLDTVTRQLGGIEKTVSSTNRTMQTAFASMEGALRRVGTQFVAAFGTKQFIEAAREMQNLEARLKQTTGSAENAATSMKLLKDIAGEQHVDLVQLTDGYNRLLPAVKSGAVSFDDMVRILKLTNDNVRALGISTSDIDGLMLGLSQTLGSGSVTMEDLRQVTDRIPGSLAAMAKAMGTNVGGLKDMASKGQLTIDVIKGPLIEALASAEGAASKMGGTYDAASADMNNAFREFADTVAKSGLFDLMVDGIQEVTNAFKVAEAIFLRFELSWMSVRDSVQQGIRDLAEKLPGGDKLNETLFKVDADKQAAQQADVLSRYNDVLEDLADTSDKAKIKTDDLAHALEGTGGSSGGIAKAATEAEKKARKLQKAIDDLVQAAENDNLAVGMTEAQKATFEFDLAVQSLRKQYGAFAYEQEEALAAARDKVIETAALQEAKDAAEKAAEQMAKQQERYAEMMTEPYKNALEDLQSTMTDTFEGIFDGSIDDADDAAKAIKKIFTRMAAELLTLQIFNGGLFTSAAAATGGMAASTGTATTGGSTGIGSLLSGASSLLNAGTNTLYQLAGSSGTVAGITSGIDAFGASNLGTASLPWQGATLTSYLGSTLTGAGIGSLASSLLGLGSGNATLDTGLGLTGAAIGSLGGPIGSAIGSTLATALGGLFSQKPSDKTAAGSITLGPNNTWDLGALSGNKFSQENADLRDAILSYAGEVANIVEDELNSSLSQQLTVRIGNRDGYRYSLGGGTEKNFGSNADAFYESLTKDIIALGGEAATSSEKLQNLNTAVGNIDFTDATQAVSDLEFALNFDELGKTAETVSTVKQAIEDLNDTFDTYRETAARLGLQVEKVTEAQEKQMQALRDSYLQSVNDSIIEALVPGYSTIKTLYASYSEAMSDAAALGLSSAEISRVTAAYQLQIAQAQQSNSEALQEQADTARSLVSRYSQVSSTLSDFLDEIKYGSYSASTPTQTLAALRAEVQSVGAAAQLGNADAQERLAELLPQLLDLSGEVNGFNAAYAEDLSLAQKLAEATKSVADRQVDIQQGILDAVNDTNGLLEQYLGSATGGNANDKLVAALQSGYSGLSEDEIRAIFTSAGVTVQPGDGRVSAFLNGNSAINDQLNTIFHALGVPGFATGGVVGGRPGLDTNLAWLTKGEGVLNLRAMQGIGEPALAYMNSTGRLPAASNDNRVASAIEAQTRAIETQTRVIAAAGQITAEHLAGIRTSNAAMRDLTEQMVASA